MNKWTSEWPKEHIPSLCCLMFIILIPYCKPRTCTVPFLAKNMCVYNMSMKYLKVGHYTTKPDPKSRQKSLTIVASGKRSPSWKYQQTDAKLHPSHYTGVIIFVLWYRCKYGEYPQRNPEEYNFFSLLCEYIMSTRTHLADTFHGTTMQATGPGSSWTQLAISTSQLLTVTKKFDKKITELIN